MNVDLPGSGRDEGVTVESGMRRKHRPGQTVVCPLRNHPAAGLVQPGVGAHHADRGLGERL